MINGLYNPRTDPANFDKFYGVYGQWADMKSATIPYLPNAKKYTSAKNYQVWKNSTNTKVNLFNQTEGEALVNFGGRFQSIDRPYNMHYLNES